MDDTQLASPVIAQNKALTAARFRRPTQVFFDLYEKGNAFAGTLDPTVVASPDGIPLVFDGKLIGGIGCSGATGAQDAVVSQVGADAIAKK
jgi:uncharacterized protein GlcG (DUF336 family)